MRAAPVQRTILSTGRIMVPPLTLCAYMKKGPNLRWGLIQCSGGDEGDRTPDLLTASQALSQLSYAPVRRSTIRELNRRCKDIFGKTFAPRPRAPESRGVATAETSAHGADAGARPGRLGPSMPDQARGTRPAGGRRCRPPAYQASLRSPPGSPPRNRPIYYVWATSPDHGVSGKNKTAGRRPAVFAKYGVWSRGRG